MTNTKNGVESRPLDECNMTDASKEIEDLTEVDTIIVSPGPDPSKILVINDVVVDRGWAWVVVVAAFLSSFVVGIMFIAFSILYMEFTDHFQSEKGVTGWIGSIFLASGNILGM